jgi:hypothetical protein
MRLGLILISVVAASCSDGSLLPSGDSLAPGTWGGDNAAVIVTDSATHVHIGCTFGDMPGKVLLDANGRFTIDGSYTLLAYPIPIGPSLPAQFSGRVRGRTLTLAVAVNDTVAKKVVSLGPIEVTYHRDPQMGPCPICRAPRRWPAAVPAGR